MKVRKVSRRSSLAKLRASALCACLLASAACEEEAGDSSDEAEESSDEKDVDVETSLDGGRTDARARLDAAELRPPSDARAPDARAVDASLSSEVALPFECPVDRFGLQKVALGSISLRVACQGQRGPVLLLLHGYPEFYLAWNKLSQPLVDAGYRLVAPDLRGHGGSDKPTPTESYDIDLLVSDVRELIQKTGQRQVVIVAHDWGGVVAWIVAHRHPELVRGLVVLSAPHPDIWGNRELDPVQAQASDSYIPFLAGPLGGLALGTIEPMLAPHLSADELAEYRNVWKEPATLPAMNKWYQANVFPTYSLPTGIEFDLPTLVLWGEKDSFTTPSELEHIPKFAPKARVVKFPNADHWLTHQETDAIVKHIQAYEGSLP